MHGATLTVSNCTFSGNQAIGSAGYGLAGGGGIDNEPGGILHVSQSTFNDNRAQGGDGGTISDKRPFIGLGFGGAIQNFFATATIDQCTFTGNQAVGGSGVSGGSGASQYDEAAALGGGVWNYGTGSSMTVSRSTFAYNQAIGGSNSTVGTSGMGHVGDAGGGALETEGGGTVTITDSTFDHNQAIGGSNIQGNDHNFIAGWGHGGAISNSSWTPTAGTAPGANPSIVIASNLTITNNEAIGGAGCTGPLAGLGDGGGVENWYGGTFTISGSTIANNQAIGGGGAAGQNGSDGLGGALANVMGATFTIGDCTMTGNQAVGGSGGSGGNGGNGLGGGLYNQGGSSFGASSLTVTGSTVTDNSAAGGAAGSGGAAGLGESAAGSTWPTVGWRASTCSPRRTRPTTTPRPITTTSSARSPPAEAEQGGNAAPHDRACRSSPEQRRPSLSLNLPSTWTYHIHSQQGGLLGLASGDRVDSVRGSRCSSTSARSVGSQRRFTKPQCEPGRPFRAISARNTESPWCRKASPAFLPRLFQPRRTFT